MTLRPVAHIENDFATKFGLPRQSGLGSKLLSHVVLEKEYAREDYLRGIDEFSHLWLLWGFDVPDSRKATVRPPRLGGNERRGVFATRSPFRPNPLGLSVVKLEETRVTEGQAFLTVSGADMKDGTIIYDIKPYLPYADAVTGACGGFAEAHAKDRLNVVFPDDLKAKVDPQKLDALIQTLSLDPRPQYQRDPERVYGFLYGGRDVRFRVDADTLIVVEIAEV
ncbi:MAG: tRNA (N6-threonylcarbamoyladenosine(37)-N6)-methyltransferase TrmO [Clostridia bacterium]|nr:tRNA (N6-threonylcarbamoyladenosine(37)-N6)-methyltransferase TrmO [Clostridia bacterium]